MYIYIYIYVYIYIYIFQDASAWVLPTTHQCQLKRQHPGEYGESAHGARTNGACTISGGGLMIAEWMIWGYLFYRRPPYWKFKCNSMGIAHSMCCIACIPSIGY